MFFQGAPRLLELEVEAPGFLTADERHGEHSKRIHNQKNEID